MLIVAEGNPRSPALSEQPCKVSTVLLKFARALPYYCMWIKMKRPNEFLVYALITVSTDITGMFPCQA